MAASIAHRDDPAYRPNGGYAPSRPPEDLYEHSVELTSVAGPHELYVVLGADKRGGMFFSGGDAFGHFRVSHQETHGNTTV